VAVTVTAVSSSAGLDARTAVTVSSSAIAVVTVLPATPFTVIGTVGPYAGSALVTECVTTPLCAPSRSTSSTTDTTTSCGTFQSAPVKVRVAGATLDWPSATAGTTVTALSGLLSRTTEYRAGDPGRPSCRTSERP
jgi:hypothetical protein